MPSWLDKIATGIADKVESAVDAVEQCGKSAEQRLEEEFKPLPPSAEPITQDHNKDPARHTRPEKRQLTSNELNDLEKFEVIYTSHTENTLNRTTFTSGRIEVGSHKWLILLIGQTLATSGQLLTGVAITSPWGDAGGVISLFSDGRFVPAGDFLGVGYLITFGNIQLPKGKTRNLLSAPGPAGGAIGIQTRHLGHWPMIPPALIVNSQVLGGTMSQTQMVVWGNVL